MKLKYAHPRFFLAFLRNIWLKIKYGNSISLNPFKVYIQHGVKIRISGSGRLIFREGGHRTFITRGSDLFAINATLEIGAGVFLNKNCTIDAHVGVVIGADTMFGPNVSVFDSDHEFRGGKGPFRTQGYRGREISIGRNVWLGTNVVVTKGASIGDNVVVGASSIVNGLLNNSSVYAGNPLRFIREISE